MTSLALQLSKHSVYTDILYLTTTYKSVYKLNRAGLQRRKCNLNLRASSVDRSLWIILQVRMSSYKSGFAALTEQKRSTYQMLLSLVHRVAQYIKRSNEDDIRNELLYCGLLKMTFFPYFQNQSNLPFSLGFSPSTELFREINQHKQQTLNSHIRW